MKITKLDEWAIKSKNAGVSYGKLQQAETLEKIKKENERVKKIERL